MRFFRDQLIKIGKDLNQSLDVGLAAIEEKNRQTEESNRNRREKFKAIEEDVNAEMELLEKFRKFETDSSSADAQDDVEATETIQDGIIGDNLAIVAKFIRDKVGTMAIDFASDTEKLSELSRSAYQALPMPVRLVVREQLFVDWILQHQAVLISAIKESPKDSHADTSEPRALLMSAKESSSEL